MRTKKPFSTISYNSDEFLKARLDELHDKHIIYDYMFINHLPEQDETKKHKHVYICPNTMIDTMDFQKLFTEVDFEHELPLKCIQFRSSKIDHWILYALHNKQYLTIMCHQERKYHYNKEDIIYCDKDEFEANYYNAFHESEFAERLRTLDVIKNSGNSPADLIYHGFMSLNQATQLNSLKNLEAKYGTTFRNGRQGHE